MLKRLLPAVMVFITLTASAQGVTYDKGKVQRYWIDHTNQYDLHLTFTNKTGVKTGIVYTKLMVDWPSKWVVQFCDDVNCHADFYDRDTFEAIANNAEGDLHITAYPQGNADTAVFQYEIFALSNPSQKDTATVYFYVPWGAGVSEPGKAALKLFPNPATDILNFTTASAGNCQVLDINGRSLITTYAEAGHNKLNIAAIPAGVYFIQVNTADGILRKEFVKN